MRLDVLTGRFGEELGCDNKTFRADGSTSRFVALKHAGAAVGAAAAVAGKQADRQSGHVYRAAVAARKSAAGGAGERYAAVVVVVAAGGLRLARAGAIQMEVRRT